MIFRWAERGAQSPHGLCLRSLNVLVLRKTWTGVASTSHRGPHPLLRKPEQGQEVAGVPGPSRATGPNARSPARAQRAETGWHRPSGLEGQEGGQGPQEGRPSLGTSVAHRPRRLAPEAHAGPDLGGCGVTPGSWADVLKPICHSGFNAAVNCLLPPEGWSELPGEEGPGELPRVGEPQEGQRVLLGNWVGWGRGE